MRRLLDTLLDHDLGHLRILAEMWGTDLPKGDKRLAAEALSLLMQDPTALLEIVESLAPAAGQALSDLLAHGGRVPAADFQRRHGSLREMGPGRRDREKPWRSPTSATESLWYHGLIGRAFIDSPSGPQEFIFIPKDLHVALPHAPISKSQPMGAKAKAPAVENRATSAAVDDATTLLAALRRKPVESTGALKEHASAYDPFLRHPDCTLMLVTLLVEAGILQTNPLEPDPTRARDFLDLPRGEALNTLLQAWLVSQSWNDLAHSPGLTNEADTWPNDPAPARRAIIDFINTLPLKTWWDLESFIQDIHLHHPSFQRLGGDFDSWYLRRSRDGQFLRGFDHWDEVEGALLRHILSGPLHWLGVVDVGKMNETGPMHSFRLTELAAVLRSQESVFPVIEESAKVTLQADGRVIVPLGAPRSHRYQIARFSAWGSLDERGYHYLLTARALERASEQGLEVHHIMTILETASDGPIPKSVKNGLQRWEAHGTEAEIHDRLLIKVRDPDVLRELLEDRRTARYISEQLNKTHALVRRKNWPQLCEAAARLGVFIDPPSEIQEDRV